MTTRSQTLFWNMLWRTWGRGHFQIRLTRGIFTIVGGAGGDSNTPPKK